MKKLIFLSLAFLSTISVQADFHEFPDALIYEWTSSEGPLGRYVVAVMDSSLVDEEWYTNFSASGFIIMMGEADGKIYTIEGEGEVLSEFKVNLAISTFEGDRKVYPLCRGEERVRYSSLRTQTLHQLWKYQEEGIFTPNLLQPRHFEINNIRTEMVDDSSYMYPILDWIVQVSQKNDKSKAISWILDGDHKPDPMCPGPGFFVSVEWKCIQGENPDNTSVLAFKNQVIDALQNQDFESFANFFHPSEKIYFTTFDYDDQEATSFSKKEFLSQLNNSRLNQDWTKYKAFASWVRMISEHYVSLTFEKNEDDWYLSSVHERFYRD